jgi:pimeloyl-ACP methyl ester carboxylesterase
MWKLVGIVIWIGFWVQPSHALALPQMTLGERWALEKERPMQSVSESTREVLQNRHVLFVPGIMNEFVMGLANYFSATRYVVEKEFGSKTSFFWSSSRLSIADNSEKLYQKIRYLHEATGKPIILVGHSKGGAEALLTVLKHPHLILSHTVDRVVLIQAAIGGSYLASCDGYLFNLPQKGLEWFFYSGITSVSCEQARERFEHGLNWFETYLNHLYGDIGEDIVRKKWELISDKIFYVRSYARPQELSVGLRIVSQFIQKNLYDFGNNDGIIMSDHQKLPGIGIDLGLIRSDHMELTVSGIFSRASERDRRAFTRALFEQIFQYGDEGEEKVNPQEEHLPEIVIQENLKIKDKLK